MEKNWEKLGGEAFGRGDEDIADLYLNNASISRRERQESYRKSHYLRTLYNLLEPVYNE